jgi:hypothetical protein
MAILTASNWVPQSEADKETVCRQLEKLFTHPTFKSSRRCPAFLQYIVEQQLKGDSQQLKERIIGAEVFGREPDYDTSADPVVRTTASEVRKRIAQYYQEPGHESELRIELPLGSYAAEFHLPPPEAQAQPAHGTSIETAASLAQVITSARPRKWLKPAALGLATVIAVAALVAWRVHAKPSGINDFWRPVLNAQGSTLVCLNTWDLSRLAQGPNSPFASALNQPGIDPTQWLPISDAEAFSRVTAFLGASQANYRMQGARTTTLSDLMQGPSILIGIFGNPWTQRVTEPLRFYFVRQQGDPDVYIADRKDASKHYDVMDGASGAGARDYALIGRILNPATGQDSFIIAGLNAAGTTAASDFVTSPRYMDYLKSVVPNLSSAKNVEAVISVQVIDGRPGAPHVEAADSW